MQQSRTDISSIGEFGLIERIRQIVRPAGPGSLLEKNLLAGISDDAAVYRPTPGMVELLTTDALVEGIHFDLTFTSLKHLGWKSMAASFSDIAAMGGTPRYALVSLSLPKKISVEMVEEFYSGAQSACREYSCILAGGDTTASRANMMVSVTVAGEAEEERVRYRSGAKPGQLLCVSGHLGASVAGLKILQRAKMRFEEAGRPAAFNPDFEPYAPALEKHLMPKPRLDIAAIVTTTVTIGAMIDISDGLAAEVHHICRESTVGASVYERSIPLHSVTQKIAEELSESPTDYGLYGGEDYELLFTIDDAEYAKLEKLTADVSIVGRITEASNGIELVREQGEHEMLRPGGWNHFAR